MIKDPDRIAPPGSASDRIVFIEQGIHHSFQYEGTGPEPDREDAFLRVNFVSVYVSDQERSKRFFLEQLGFKLMIDERFPSGYRWIEVAPPDGSARLALVLPALGFVDNGLAGRSSLITFMTDDVEGKYREWAERGVRFSKPPHTPEWGGSFCRFEDLDGNPFGLAGFNDVKRALEAQRKGEAQRREARRLAAQELEIAKQVQARLLPQRLPTIPTLDYAGICVQARVVGGDYYDLLELGRDRGAIVVADIAGKGIGAALLMANWRQTCAECAGPGTHPEQALSLVTGCRSRIRNHAPMPRSSTRNTTRKIGSSATPSAGIRPACCCTATMLKNSRPPILWLGFSNIGIAPSPLSRCSKAPSLS